LVCAVALGVASAGEKPLWSVAEQQQAGDRFVLADIDCRRDTGIQ
jgi:hypothetical protein